MPAERVFDYSLEFCRGSSCFSSVAEYEAFTRLLGVISLTRLYGELF